MTRPNAMRRELAAYLGECAASGEEPVTDTHSFYRLMEKRLSANFDGLTPRHAYAAQAQFQTKVLRELNLLAAAGALVKTGDRRHLRFLTPAAAQRQEELEQERQRQKEALQRRVAGLRLRLQALGVQPGSYVEIPIRLNADDWDILVELAEKGQEERVKK